MNINLNVDKLIENIFSFEDGIKLNLVTDDNIFVLTLISVNTLQCVVILNNPLYIPIPEKLSKL